ncbi:hypothetical protein SSOG_02339 [Streptomyces himastatinicus ATCC 53653]|uniref:Uncharacterized protein n=1 Tax=Streptomyces himastatinicus ATCC 53653 TaxID=457427 RepID=D9W8B8_9ACTN|nr:hypothetical protein [Streptomyces himastatinicus]EFL22625.1 hypothetical protein SSOG_02339 [Streptomyces himastatinicus ATCC 53653]
MAAFDFDQELRDLALDQAPRVFAVAVQYEVEPGALDGEIAAWGLAYDDGSAHVVTANGRHRLSLTSPERATWWFGREKGITARIVWFAAPTAPAFERAEAA